MQIIFISCLLAISILQASFYDRGIEGRYYYQDLKKPPKEKEKITRENALQELNLFKERFETTKALAVMDPTYENIISYLKLQKQVVENSEKFSQIWETILLENALLNDQLLNPTASFAISARKNLEYQNIDNLIEILGKDHILLFVFNSKEPFSQITAEMAKEFEEETRWQVIGVSLDQGTLPQFPHPRYSTDQGQSLGVNGSPAFIVVNPKSDYSVQVGFGAISLSQLKENIYKQFSKRALK